MRPSKMIVLNAKQRSIQGISRPDDSYYASLADNAEHHLALVCSRYIRATDICLDIGANIGVTTLIISDFCPEGKVLAVEPNREVHKVLRRNIAANKLTNVETARCAVGDRDGPARFFESSAFGHLAETGTEIEMVAVQTLMKRFSLSRLDFIKIDIEGFEAMVLRNAFDAIQKHRSIVHLEFNTWALLGNSRTNPVEFLDWIFEKFSGVFVVNPELDGDLLVELEPDDARQFIFLNMTKYGHVNDLVVTTEPDRIRQHLF